MWLIALCAEFNDGCILFDYDTFIDYFFIDWINRNYWVLILLLVFLLCFEILDFFPRKSHKLETGNRNLAEGHLKQSSYYSK